MSCQTGPMVYEIQVRANIQNYLNKNRFEAFSHHRVTGALLESIQYFVLRPVN